MSKIGLVGQTFMERSLPLDAQRTINFYPVLDQTGKETSALYGTPGLALFATAGTGPIRGMLAVANGRAFAVSSNTLYEINANGSVTSRGTLNTSSGIVDMDENGLQLAICDGASLYTLTYSSNAFAAVSDPDLPSCSTVAFIDGYFIVNKNNSGQFNISALFDGTSWSGLDFATAESSPDNLLCVRNAVGLLWLLGQWTIEIWQDTGALNFPFQKITGAKMDVGILAPYTAITLDNSLFWVGQDKRGSGIVYRASGFTPQRISNDAIELLIQGAPQPSQLRAYTYQQEGHTFYVITGGGMQTSLVFDIATNQWHERAYLNSSGAFEQHLGACGMYVFGLNLVGSRLDGKIYKMATNIYDDAGQPLAAERTYTHLSNENQRMKFSQLEIALESGVGNQSNPGSDPQITLWISRDGGRTYSNGYTTSMGKVGNYTLRAVWRKLGTAYNWTFRVRITDAVKRNLIGSYLH